MIAFDTIAIEFDLTHHSVKQVALDELRVNAQEKNKLYWIHSNLNQEDAFKQLLEKLRLPTEVIQLCSEEKIYPISLIMIMHSP